MIIGDTFTKDTLLFKFIEIIRYMITFVLDVRNTCRVTEIIEDVSRFCETKCEGRTLIGRVTRNLKLLSRISQEIVAIIDEKKESQSIVEEVERMQTLGRKTGEFLQIMLGFIIIY